MADGKDPNEEEHPDSWMVRPCVMYKDEYSDCTSIRGRFQQYFVHGVTEDCSPWKRDYENCLRWKENNNKKAFGEIVMSEKIRRAARLKPHYENSVWEARPEPPPEWNAPLPDWMEERNKNSYLSLKAQEMKEGKNSDELRSSFSKLKLFKTYLRNTMTNPRLSALGILSIEHEWAHAINLNKLAEEFFNSNKRRGFK